MSYAAEPYAQFVDDLLTSLTGGVVRERFVFAREERSFRLAPPGPIFPGSLEVFGQADTVYRRFQQDRDFRLLPDGVIEWKARPNGTPAADAVWPDDGTPVFVNYDFKQPAGAVPLLSDRNVGSVTRLVAESFAREFAVLSLQLESVYEAGFLDTATGRDLDQLVALLGLERRNPTFASGKVVFSRGSPAPADVAIPAGTRLSTAEPPVAVFETTETVTLHRGALSVDAPVRALAGGAGGVVPARAVSTINRTILGVDAVANSEATSLGGAAETDEGLRARARRALDTAAKATPAALVGALGSLPGVREKDILIEEDPVKRPGVITLRIAAELAPEQAARAVELIEAHRPVGVRVLHDLHTPATLPSVSAAVSDDDGRDDEADPAAIASAQALFYPVVATAVLLPSAANLTPDDRLALKRKGEEAIKAFIGEAGIGETLVYNRMVAALMDIEGVLDVQAELYPASLPGAPPVDPATQKRRRNLDVPARLRATVDAAEDGGFNVDVGGQLVALNLAVTVRLKGLAALPDADPDVMKEDARLAILGDLTDKVAVLGTLDRASLKGAITAKDFFSVEDVTYKVELIDAGLRVSQADLVVTLDARQRPWIRTLTVGTP